MRRQTKSKLRVCTFSNRENFNLVNLNWHADESCQQSRSRNGKANRTIRTVVRFLSRGVRIPVGLSMRTRMGTVQMQATGMRMSMLPCRIRGVELTAFISAAVLVEQSMHPRCT